jgi:hypothetical protein
MATDVRADRPVPSLELADRMHGREHGQAARQALTAAEQLAGQAATSTVAAA